MPAGRPLGSTALTPTKKVNAPRPRAAGSRLTVNERDAVGVDVMDAEDYHTPFAVEPLHELVRT